MRTTAVIACITMLAIMGCGNQFITLNDTQETIVNPRKIMYVQIFMNFIQIQFENRTALDCVYLVKGERDEEAARRDYDLIKSSLD